MKMDVDIRSLFEEVDRKGMREQSSFLSATMTTDVDARRIRRCFASSFLAAPFFA
jgi:hypothetical protein